MLDDSDDVLSEFVVANVLIEPGVDVIDVRFDLKLTDPTIEAMLEDRSARLSVKWRCSSTMLTREMALTPTASIQGFHRYGFAVAQEEVLGDVRVSVRVVAARHIEPYQLQNQNPEYGGALFEVFTGDLLADGGVFEFNPRKAHDPLVPPLESCFRFESVGGPKRSLDVQLGDPDQVVVSFPEETFALFAAQQGRPEVQVSLVVLPALVTVLWRMQRNREWAANDEESFRDFAWFRAINGAIQRLGCENDDPFVQAKKILDTNPISAALATLNVDDEGISTS